MKNKKDKIDEFDSVGFMRKRRNELSKLYLNNPDKYEKDLEKIKKKYWKKYKKTHVA